MPEKTQILPLTAWELLTKAIDLVGLFLAMWLSELLVDNIIIGGAIYLAGEVWVIYARLYSKRNIDLLPTNIRGNGVFIFILCCLLSGALFLVYPNLQAAATRFILLLLLLGFILQQILTDIIAHRPSLSGLRRTAAVCAAHLIFLLSYPVTLLANQHLLQYPIPPEIPWIYLATIAISAALCFCELKDGASERPAPGDNSPAGDALLSVRAYRIYNKMAVNTFFALNLSITSFIFYLRFLPFRGFGHSLLMLLIWLVYIALVVLLCLSLLQKRYLPRYDRYAIFAAGVILWLVGTLGMLRGWWGEGALSALLCAGFLGASLACMVSILLMQSYEMKSVIELGVGKIDEGAYHRNTSSMIDWSILTSYLLLLTLLTISSFIMDGSADKFEAALGMQSLLRAMMLVLPLLIVSISVVYAMLQPLDRNYAQKLQKYEHQRREGESAPALEGRLKEILVGNTPRRILLLILKPLVRPFLPCRVIGREHVDLSDGPAVFLCNHLEMMGPVMTILHSPFYIRPWVIQNMLDKDLILVNIRGGMDASFGFLPQRLRYWLGARVAPLVRRLLMSADPIPVYRGTVRGLMKTLQLSDEALAYDDNILLFPETTYPKEGVGDFFTGFVQLGNNYHRRTGKRLTFYPMYINMKKRTMTYGEGIQYDPQSPSSDERDRIVGYLHDTMERIAREGA